MAGKPTTFNSSTHIPLLELDSITEEDRIRIDNYIRHTNMQFSQLNAQVQFMHGEVEDQTKKRLGEVAENIEQKSKIKAQAKKISELETAKETLEGTVETLEGNVSSLRARRRVWREENASLRNENRELKSENGDLKNQNDSLKKELSDLKENEESDLKGLFVSGNKRMAKDDRENEEDSNDGEDEEESPFVRHFKKLKEADSTEEKMQGNFFANAVPQEARTCIIS